MKTEMEFVNSKNVTIVIECVSIMRIDLNNIEYIDFYINDKKTRSFYRISSSFCLDQPILCKDMEILKVVVGTKNDENVEIKIFGSSLFVFSDKVE